MKINHNHYPQIHPTQGSKASNEISDSAPTAALRSAPAAAIDPVLGDAQTQLQAMPEIDMDRVAEMKLAIGNGQVTVDLDELARSIQKYFQR